MSAVNIITVSADENRRGVISWRKGQQKDIPPILGKGEMAV